MFVLNRAWGKRATKNAAALRSTLGMNMHELLASGPLLVTCVAQSGLRASGVRQGVVVELSINMPLWWHPSRNMTPPPRTAEQQLHPGTEWAHVSVQNDDILSSNNISNCTNSLTRSHTCELQSGFWLKVTKTHWALKDGWSECSNVRTEKIKGILCHKLFTKRVF